MNKRWLLIFILFILILISGCVHKQTTNVIPEGITEEIQEGVINTTEDQASEEFVEVVEEITEETVEEESIEEAEEEIIEKVKPEQQIPFIIKGKTVEQRIKEAYEDLHEPGSATRIKENFPDLELVYTDNPEEPYKSFFPPYILPLKYYYSRESNLTFNLCNIDRSVFICKGKQDRLISKEDVDSGRCVVTFVYRGDPRWSGIPFGGQKVNYDYGFEQITSAYLLIWNNIKNTFS